jgi:hypothetical protein
MAETYPDTQCFSLGSHISKIITDVGQSKVYASFG